MQKHNQGRDWMFKRGVTKVGGSFPTMRGVEGGYYIFISVEYGVDSPLCVDLDWLAATVVRSAGRPTYTPP